MVPHATESYIPIVSDRRHKLNFDADVTAPFDYSGLVYVLLEAVTEGAGPPAHFVAITGQDSGQCCISTFRFVRIARQRIKRIYYPGKNKHLQFIDLMSFLAERD